MLILGIETSCDETAAAVVADGRRVLSNVVASQISVHERFGGVVPEIASRQHILAIDQVVDRALKDAEVGMVDLDAIGVTVGPGLSGALLVGTSFAKGLSLGAGVELRAVDHIEGHVLSPWLGFDEASVEPPLPMIALVVSGGHTELVLVTAPGAYVVLGRTVDDAAGEAYDKVGRLLGLPFPGGPNVEAAARQGNFNPTVEMPRAWLRGSYDFSFSGLKAAMSREVSRRRALADGGRLPAGAVGEFAAAFQESVADVLSGKLALAVAETGASSAAIVGGVANNEYIREKARERLSVSLYAPAAGLSSDNAAMIAGAAYWNPRVVDLDFDIDPSLRLEEAGKSRLPVSRPGDLARRNEPE